MLKYIRLNCIILAGILLVPSASFCTTELWLPPFANVVQTGRAVVVAFNAGEDVLIESRDVASGHKNWSTRIPAAMLARDICQQQGLVYVAMENQDVYVLSSETGDVKVRLQSPYPVSGGPIVACASNHLFVAYGDARNWKAWLVAYSTQSFRPIHKRFFGDAGISEITANNGELEVLVVNRSPRRRFERYLFRSNNMRLVARRAGGDPCCAVPRHLPKAVRRWYSKTVVGSTLGDVSPVRHRGNLWFVGVPGGLNLSGIIYAGRTDGRVVWATRVNGLSSVVLAG